MNATTASEPPILLTLDELADSLGGTPEELAEALGRGHELGAIRLLPDHEGGPSVLLPAFVAERLGVGRAEPCPDVQACTEPCKCVPEARPRTKAPRPPARNRFREALDALRRSSEPPPAAF
jgi:hypothetical protein